MNRAALRYAKATLSLALESKKESEVNNNMLLINSTIESNKDLQGFLNNPTFKPDTKNKVLAALFDSKIDKITKDVIKILIDNKRLPLLSFVAKQYNLLFEKTQGVEVAKVTTAIPLTDDLKSKILEKVKDLTNNKVTINNIIDENIIGGFILQIGDKQFDASISGKLNSLRRNFETNHYEAKI
jgi:F-type H+-transporting ATPase subunit delta